MQKKDYGLARSELDSLLELAPKDKPALVQRAAMRILTGDPEGASRDFDALIEIDEEKGLQARFIVADRTLWIARKHMNDKEYRDAQQILDAILHIFPDSAPVYHDRGGTKLELKDYKGAIADLTSAIRNAGENGSVASSYHLRAMAKRALGDEAGADEDEKRRDEALAKALKPIETEQDAGGQAR
jgi:tetratricopeptide (TPR) repeat protein